ncbi:MAG TPA: nuclear transport factor 2 family protein [Ramlibacter sp.]|uniref:nuclear transport factor 2 family protein n=1 Tax=Ramlibacter sp. TaxID=1917967 RepID=UPI002CF2BAEB|nr:nuclear transport factor 2 family protein [Ramlibacter sp.]HVZ45801.1 nuclear transport factor 2 family protein [Ramlibacter sp.]
MTHARPADPNDVLDLIDVAQDPSDSPEGRRIARRLIRHWWTTVRAKDLDSLMTVLADDIVIELPFNESGRNEEGAFRRYQGAEQVRGFWSTAFKAEGQSHGMTDVEITVSADGGKVFVEGRGNLTMANGKSYRNRYVFRFLIEQGRIRHVREYYNPITSAHAFGRPVAGKFTIDSL